MTREDFLSTHHTHTHLQNPSGKTFHDPGYYHSGNKGKNGFAFVKFSNQA